MSSRSPGRAKFSFCYLAVLAVGCLLAGCSTTHIVITASPSTAELEVTESVTITAIVTGTENPEDKEVEWSVCNGQGESCVLGGNSTLGTVVPSTSDSSGNAQAVYTAPDSVPSPPDCLETSDGCAVAVKGQLTHHDAACFSTITIHSACIPGVIERISVTSAGAQVTGGDSDEGSISGDGRFVTFASEATDVITGDANGVSDVFLRDTCRGATSCTPSTTRVSVSTGGAEANGPSDNPVISADGRFIAFESDATNLVADDTNSVTDVFLRDTCFGATSCTPTTERVSLSDTNDEGNGPSREPAISGSGRVIVFESDATNLAGADTNGERDVFVRDTCFGATSCTPTTLRASVSTADVEGNAISEEVSINFDGRFVSFQSLADNLIGSDTNFTSDVFLRDTCIGATSCSPSTTRISVSSGGAEGNGFSEEANIDGSGRLVVFGSFSDNFVTGDSNTTSDTFLRDTCFGATSCSTSTSLISVSTTGGVGNGTSFSATISRNGRYIAWDSEATNLVTGVSDTNGDFDLFVRDTCFGATSCTPETRIISVNSTGAVGNAISHVPSITSDGRFVSFESEATNLVGDDTNGTVDVFLGQTCFVP